jgi:DNA-binding MarR family transcriptional regulator
MDSPSAPAEAAFLNIGLVSFDRVTAELRRAEPGLTAEHMQTFIAVARAGLPSQTDISSITCFTRQSTSQHVAKLVTS